MRNSTATSGFPCAALRQCLTSASGNPIPVKLATTSAGNSASGRAGAGGAADGAGAAAGVSVADVVVLEAAAAGAGAAAGVFGSAGVSSFLAAAAAGLVALGLVTMTTKKSVSLIPHASMTWSSLSTFPE